MPSPEFDDKNDLQEKLRKLKIEVDKMFEGIPEEPAQTATAKETIKFCDEEFAKCLHFIEDLVNRDIDNKEKNILNIAFTAGLGAGLKFCGAGPPKK